MQKIINEKVKYFFFIDVLRAYAVLSVVFFHFPIICNNKYFTYLYDCLPGVPLFFSISGFLITKILFDKKGIKTIAHLLKIFYIRRVLRIFPIYYLTLLVLLLTNFERYKAQFLYDLLYVSNFKIGYDGSYQNTIAPHFWSLSVEEQFYLFWPFVIFFLGNQKVKFFSLFFVTTGIFSLLLSYNISSYWLFFVDRTIGNFTYIGLGCFLAFLYLKTDFFNTFNRNKRIIGFGILFIFIFGFFEFYKNGYFTFFFSILLIGFLLLISISLKKTVFFNKNKITSFFIFIGKISYGIYVYHFFTPNLLYYFNFSFTYCVFGFNVFNISSAILTLTIATVSWYTIELFFLNLKNEYNY